MEMFPGISWPGLRVASRHHWKPDRCRHTSDPSPRGTLETVADEFALSVDRCDRPTAIRPRAAISTAVRQSRALYLDETFARCPGGGCNRWS